MIKDVLKGKVRDGVLESISNGFDVIGDAAIIKLPTGLRRTEEKLVADAVMHENRHITRVFKKTGKTEGRERIPSLAWVAGKKDTLVKHKENGCSFAVDIKGVFFTPRLGSERKRVVAMVKPGETVLDMFCGVGPYTIPVAKKAHEVYAIDINPKAIELLKENLVRNKIRNVKTFRGDSKKLVPKLEAKFDRIIMNFPLAAESFLPYALKAAGKRTAVHMYTFLNTKEGYTAAVKTEEVKVKKLISKSFALESIIPIRAGEVAPFLVRECFDISVRSKKRGTL